MNKNIILEMLKNRIKELEFDIDKNNQRIMADKLDLVQSKNQLKKLNDKFENDLIWQERIKCIAQVIIDGAIGAEILNEEHSGLMQNKSAVDLYKTVVIRDQGEIYMSLKIIVFLYLETLHQY